MRVPKEFIIEMPSCPKDITLAYLIPTTSGRGVCSAALVHFLVNTHNEFINFYHSKIKIK